MIKRIIDKNNYTIDAKVVFCFDIDYTQYVVLNYDKSIFEQNSKYDDLNVFEITKTEEDKVYVDDVKKYEWKKIKDFLNNKIFSNL